MAVSADFVSEVLDYSLAAHTHVTFSKPFAKSGINDYICNASN